MHEALIFEHRVDRLIQLVLSDELVVVVKRNREAVRDRDAAQPRLHHFAKVSGLRAVSDDGLRALLAQARNPCDAEIEMRLHQIEPLKLPLLIFIQHIVFSTLNRVGVALGLEDNPPAVELFEDFLRVLDVSVRHAPGLRQQIDMREGR